VAEIDAAGSIVGEAGIFLEHRTASLRSLSHQTELTVVRLNHKSIRKVIANRPDTGLTLCRSLAKRLAGLSTQIRTAGHSAATIRGTWAQLAMQFMHLLGQAQNLSSEPSLAKKLAPLLKHPVTLQAKMQERFRSDSAVFFRSELESSHADVAVLDTGDSLFEEGDQGAYLYLVQKGRLEVKVGSQVVSEIFPGEMTGELAVLLEDEIERKRTATVVAAAPTELVTISKENFLTAAVTRTNILVNLAYTLSQRIETTNRLFCDLDNGLRDELNRIARGSESCEDAFLQLTMSLPAAIPGAPDLLTEAKELALQAAAKRREQEASFLRAKG
ncbi:MAG: cyclic nucleotide-binding domain-containing protein, partial [Planctomycetota bacterium]|jgi:CRP-like cAMP-binding protein